MTWAQVHALADDGNEIGGHTAHHVDLTQSTRPRRSARSATTAST